MSGDVNIAVATLVCRKPVQVELSFGSDHRERVGGVVFYVCPLTTPFGLRAMPSLEVPFMNCLAGFVYKAESRDLHFS